MLMTASILKAQQCTHLIPLESAIMLHPLLMGHVPPGEKPTLRLTYESRQGAACFPFACRILVPGMPDFTS